MPRPNIDLPKWIARIPQNVIDLPAESVSPIRHFHRGARDAWNLLDYFTRNVGRTNVHPAAFERHQHRLRRLVIVALAEAFERYLKEVGAICVDHVAPLVTDDRLKVLPVTAIGVAAHFKEDGLGKALCEASTWLDCDAVTKRFGRLLADHHSTSQGLRLFAQDVDADRYTALKTVFQLRHSIVHNLGVITGSDAAKLRLLTKRKVEPKQLWPTNGDVMYVKLFLEDTADWMNEQVIRRLETLLTDLHGADNSLFVPADKAQELATQFSTSATVAGVTRP